MAAIAPASERSLGPMPDHVPEPDRGEENKPENVPTHGPEHGPEGRPENVPADQMPVEPGPEPGPEPGVAPGPEHREHRPHRPEGGPDDDDGLAFKPEIAKRQAPTVLGNIGADGRPTPERVLDRGRAWLPPEVGFSVALGEERLAFRPPADVIQWRGSVPMRYGLGQIKGTCFVRIGRVTYPCDAAEKKRVAQNLLIAQVLHWRGLSKVATLTIPTREKVVIHSKDQQHQVSLGMDPDSATIQSLSTVEGALFSNLGEAAFEKVASDMVWESGDLVAHGAMERAQTEEFWALCSDYDGALETVSARVDVLRTRAKKRGAAIDTRRGLVVEPDSEAGGRVCVPLLGEVDGASRFGTKSMGQRWHRGREWSTIVKEKSTLQAWLTENAMAPAKPLRWRIRVFDTPVVMGPNDGVAVLEVTLAAAPNSP